MKYLYLGLIVTVVMSGTDGQHYRQQAPAPPGGSRYAPAPNSQQAAAPASVDRYGRPVAAAPAPASVDRYGRPVAAAPSQYGPQQSPGQQPGQPQQRGFMPPPQPLPLTSVVEELRVEVNELREEVAEAEQEIAQAPEKTALEVIEILEAHEEADEIRYSNGAISHVIMSQNLNSAIIGGIAVLLLVD